LRKISYLGAVIGDPDNHSEEYRRKESEFKKTYSDVLVLNFPGLKPNPDVLSHEDAIAALKATNKHLCDVAADAENLRRELSSYVSPLLGRSGLLKKYQMERLHARYFYRLIAQRYYELSPEELSPLLQRGFNILKYEIKRLPPDKFIAHFEKAVDKNRRIRIYGKDKSNQIAFKAMAIGVIQDYINRTLRDDEKEEIMAEGGLLLKDINRELIFFHYDGLDNALEFENPNLPKYLKEVQ
jgi:hypothetical protein